MKYCANCGQQLNDDDRFCGKCGTKSPPAQYMAPAGSQEANISDVNVGAVNSIDEIAATNQIGSQTGVNGAGGAPVQEYPTYTPPAQTRLRWPYILAGILGVLLLGAGLLYHFGNFGAPATPQLAPVDTEVFICVKPNLLQARNFSNLQEIYESDPETKKALENMLQELHLFCEDHILLCMSLNLGQYVNMQDFRPQKHPINFIKEIWLQDRKACQLHLI